MKKYFCLKCKRTHSRGKIYEDHLEFREKINKRSNPNHKTKNPVPSNEIIEFENHLKKILKNLESYEEKIK